MRLFGWANGPDQAVALSGIIETENGAVVVQAPQTGPTILAAALASMSRPASRKG
jgi:hypothetical protein